MDQYAILKLQQQVAALSSEVAALRREVDAQADTLESHERFEDTLLKGLHHTNETVADLGGHIIRHDKLLCPEKYIDRANEVHHLKKREDDVY